MSEENGARPGDESVDTVLSSIRRILQEGKDAHAAAQAATQPAEEAHIKPPAPPPPVADEDDSVLLLDSSMVASDEPASHEETIGHPVPESHLEPEIPPQAPEAHHQEDHQPEVHHEPPAAHEPEAVSQPEIHAEAAEAALTPEPAPVALEPVAVVTSEIKQPRTRMSETINTPEFSGASDSDAPLPVQIALDKQTVGATEHSFGALQQMLRRKQAYEHKERRVSITRGGNLTIEDIVRDEVRAFLKEWLDQHLSSIVQQAVQKEIERLSDR